MKKSILIMLILTTLASVADAQWSLGSGIDGGDIRCLAKIGDDVYAGSMYGGVFRSSNEGQTWVPMLTGLPSGVKVSRIMSFSDALFIGTGYASKKGRGIYRSTDQGNTWTQKNNGIVTTGDIFDLDVTGLAASGGYLFAAINMGGVYRSNDLGETWNFIDTDSTLSNKGIFDICAIGNTLFAGTQYGSAYRSVDYGVTWQSINVGLPSGAYVIDIRPSGSDLYCRTGSGFYWSPSMGDYWIPINNGITSPSAAVGGTLTVEGSTLFAETWDGTEGAKSYKSINKGQTWTNLTSLTGTRIMAFQIINTNTTLAAYLGPHGGILRTIDAGDTWASSIEGLSARICKAITSIDDLVFSGASFCAGIYASSDEGASWNSVADQGTFPVLNVLALKAYNNIIFAGVNSNAGVYKSADNGHTWLQSGAINEQVYALDANNSYLFAGTRISGMRRSSDNGNSWTTINTGLPSTGEKSIRSIKTSGSRVFIGNSRGVFMSDNNGTNWTAINGGISSPGYVTVISLAIKGDTIFGGGPYGIIKSTNRGNTWTLLPNTDGLQNAMLLKGDTLFAAGSANVNNSTNAQGVYMSVDWGETWVTMNQSFPSIPDVSSLLLNNNKLYVGTTGYSTWVMDLNASADKTLSLSSIYLEGLYSGAGAMNQANDDMGPHFAAGIADQVTVELHNAADYATIAYSAIANLSTSGTISLPVPSVHSGSYYITIKHRNSVETTTAAPVSFATATVNYAFNAANKAYGDNLVLMAGGDYAIFCGDVNQDQLIDASDMAPIDNEASMAAAGYIAEDCNGDGLIDGSDLQVAENNAAQAIGAILP